MITKEHFEILVWTWIAIGFFIFIALLFFSAPYGRYRTAKWGLTVPDRLGWFMMELPGPLVFSILVATGKHKPGIAAIIIAGLYVAHYVNRAFIYPLRIRTRGRNMPLVIVLMAVMFNTVNAGIMGYYTGSLQTLYTAEWLTDPRFIAGIIIFVAGMTVNMLSDSKLISIRREKDSGYSIPAGGMFRWVSCPNYLGEIIEWAGYALLSWSLPALSFLLWTIFNLLPRALDHHKWYIEKFPDYPADRKAILPYII